MARAPKERPRRKAPRNMAQARKANGNHLPLSFSSADRDGAHRGRRFEAPPMLRRREPLQRDRLAMRLCAVGRRDLRIQDGRTSLTPPVYAYDRCGSPPNSVCLRKSAPCRRDRHSPRSKLRPLQHPRPPPPRGCKTPSRLPTKPRRSPFPLSSWRATARSMWR